MVHTWCHWCLTVPTFLERGLSWALWSQPLHFYSHTDTDPGKYFELYLALLFLDAGTSCLSSMFPLLCLGRRCRGWILICLINHSEGRRVCERRHPCQLQQVILIISLAILYSWGSGFIVVVWSIYKAWFQWEHIFILILYLNCMSLQSLPNRVQE